LYIEPQYGWHKWYSEFKNDVNFTWSVKELTETKMRIKLDFNDPPNVSPFIRYDKLVIHIPDLSKLFQQKKTRKLDSNGRRLDNVNDTLANDTLIILQSNDTTLIEQTTLSKSIQKQGYDTPRARSTLN
jgi:hypothetical protein